jgi:hypothetical protein
MLKRDGQNGMRQEGEDARNYEKVGWSRIDEKGYGRHGMRKEVVRKG